MILHGFYRCTLFTCNFSLVTQANDFTSWTLFSLTCVCIYMYNSNFPIYDIQKWCIKHRETVSMQHKPLSTCCIWRCSWHLWHTDFTTLYVHAIFKMLSEALVPMKAICSKWEFSLIFERFWMPASHLLNFIFWNIHTCCCCCSPYAKLWLL